MRSKFESIVPTASEPMMTVHEELATQLNMWIADEGLIASQSTNEKPLVSKALGSWNRQELIDSAWRANSLGAILWALSFFETMPSWDKQFTPQETIKPLNLFASITAFLEKARLRPAAEIEKMRDLAGLWYWRSRQEKESYAESAQASESRNRAETIAAAAQKAFSAGDIPEPINGDFPVFGRAYAEITADEYREANSIAVERLYALNWICGYSEDWDAVPLGG